MSKVSGTELPTQVHKNPIKLQILGKNPFKNLCGKSLKIPQKLLFLGF
jgi:hypothetical protein